MEFSERIAAIRKDMHLSQEKFGELVNVSQRSVAAWESGDRLPSLNVLSDLAAAIGVTVDYLIGRDETIKKQPTVKDDELLAKTLSRVQALSDPALQRVQDFLDGLEAGQAIHSAPPAAQASTSEPDP